MSFMTKKQLAVSLKKLMSQLVFTEEYSVRAARIAVYTLLGVDKKICPVTPYRRNVRTLLKALSTRSLCE